MHTYLHRYISIHIYIYIHTYIIHMYTYIDIYTCIHAKIHTSNLVDLCIHKVYPRLSSLYIHIYLNAYIHRFQAPGSKIHTRANTEVNMQYLQLYKDECEKIMAALLYHIDLWFDSCNLQCSQWHEVGRSLLLLPVAKHLVETALHTFPTTVSKTTWTYSHLVHACTLDTWVSLDKEPPSHLSVRHGRQALKRVRPSVTYLAIACPAIYVDVPPWSVAWLQTLLESRHGETLPNEEAPW